MITKTIENNILFPEIIKLLADGKNVTFRAKGNSMLPFIRGDGDTVTLQPADSIRKWDIVLARTSTGLYILHRVIDRQKESITLMGDGNLFQTEQCDLHEVYGKVVRITRPNGKNIDCTTRKARLSAKVWAFLSPARRILLAVYRRITHYKP